GPTSTESARYLLQHGPDRDPYNLYYWYYGTLAMYQHGGESWDRWNALVRDAVVRRQRVYGHMAGSWDPDDSMYGARGGRIYCTALATLTLEVYYRFLRLYDDPKLPSSTPSTLASPRPGGTPPRRAVSVPDRR
ncbi:MAG: prenyltransferase/squalene oxidase repeat-containing protein, partial [Isosphaeraceae bacterium]